MDIPSSPSMLVSRPSSTCSCPSTAAVTRKSQITLTRCHIRRPSNHGVFRFVLPLVWLAGSMAIGLWGVALTRRMSAENELQYLNLRRGEAGTVGVGSTSRRASLRHVRGFPSVSTSTAMPWQPRVVHTAHLARGWQGTKPSARLIESFSHDRFRHASFRSSLNASLDEDRTRLYADRDKSSLDFPEMERRRWPIHELDPDHCVPIATWQSTFYPTCNLIHEQSFRHGVTAATTNLTGPEGGALELLSAKGFWRHAWKLDQQLSPSSTYSTTTTTTVWRTFKMDHPMEEAFFENARVDAVAMERLTSSPFIVNVHGFCGLTVVTEYAPYELSEVSLRLNSTERLLMARRVAQGVSDIHHSIEGDVADGGGGGGGGDPRRTSLVHNDLNLANLRVSQDGTRPVLNDFNIAVLLMKHRDTGETCPFASRFPNPQWRSPEEQVYSQEETDSNPPVVTEKIDIYALGNVLYRLAVGASPWKEPGSLKLSADEKMAVARLKRERGALPPVPPDIQNEAEKDVAVRLMLEAMHQAFRFRPEDRPTAKQLVDLLAN